MDIILKESITYICGGCEEKVNVKKLIPRDWKTYCAITRQKELILPEDWKILRLYGFLKWRKASD
mgnify:CR=1 FL=1